MDIGFGAPVAGAWATPGNIADFAGRAQRLGYRSLWTFQRLLVPTGSDMAAVYHSVLDPMVALGYAAAVTTDIRLGVAVVNHPFVSPLLLAKQAATLDVLSGGRLDLGIGNGWMEQEFTGSGAVMAGRGARTEEYIAALRALWSGSGERFRGSHFEIPAGKQEPLPVQKPGPPVLLGGMSRAAMERAGRVADGWVTASAANLSNIAAYAKVVQESAAAAGRTPVRIVVRGVVRAGREARTSSGERMLLSGSYEQIRDDVAWLGSCGVTEVFYDANWDPLVGNPAVSPRDAVARASEILHELAPGGGPRG
ncbi:MAG: TIGR03619 family F420-dependent LLM class oxidoreductase [Nocardiopsaceae bacterium]|nr:TIGR03619 family F420-dependent LLM class oxidoreductase [Nocardiopsaceae bacterium]